MADVCSNGVDTGFVDLGYVKVAALGVVQGITELLPISLRTCGSCHPAGLTGPWIRILRRNADGALAAVVSYFWSDIRQIAEGSIEAVAKGRWHSPEFRLALGIGVATIPIEIVGAATAHFLNACSTPARSLIFIGVACLVMSCLSLWRRCRLFTHAQLKI